MQALHLAQYGLYLRGSVYGGTESCRLFVFLRSPIRRRPSRLFEQVEGTADDKLCRRQRAIDSHGNEKRVFPQ